MVRLVPLAHRVAQLSAAALLVIGCAPGTGLPTAQPKASPTPTSLAVATPYATRPEDYVCNLIPEPNVTSITAYPIPFTFSETDPMGLSCYYYYESPPDHLVTSVGIVMQPMTREDHDADVAYRKETADTLDTPRKNEFLTGVGETAWWDEGLNYDESALYVYVAGQQVVIGDRDMQDHYDAAARKATAVALFNFVRSRLP